MTTSLCPQFPPTQLISSLRNPSTSLRNPSYFKSVPLLSNSGYLSSSMILRCRNDHGSEESHVDENDREKWIKHINRIDQQAKLLSDLKEQYTLAIDIKDYETAIRLQLEITEVTKDDAVTRVMSNMHEAIEEERYKDAAFLRDNTGAGLVGWWAGISEDQRDPYGQIIHVTAEHGRFLAKSYSPWQLATAKDGTLLFEIYVAASKEGKCEEQAIHIRHMYKEDRRVTYEPDVMKLNVYFSHLAPNPSHDMWVDTLWRYSVATGMDYTKEEFKEIYIVDETSKKNEDDEARELAKLSGEEKAVIKHVFVVGDCFTKATEKVNNDFVRLPANLDRKARFSFSLSVDNKNQSIHGVHSPKEYRTLDHAIHDYVDCIGRGIYKEEHYGHDKFWPFIIRHARNHQPLLSGSTNFNRIVVPASLDPLDGLYIGSNGFLATEVIQLRRKYGHWDKDGGIDDASKLEPYEYVEVSKLTGDPNVPAGQVAFIAKVGEEYKLSPWPMLQKTYGVVARYKGQGRLTGFQKSGWVDAELNILGGVYREDGFAIAILYSAPGYYFLKLFKQLILPGSGAH